MEIDDSGVKRLEYDVRECESSHELEWKFDTPGYAITAVLAFKDDGEAQFTLNAVHKETNTKSAITNINEVLSYIVAPTVFEKEDYYAADDLDDLNETEMFKDSWVDTDIATGFRLLAETIDSLRNKDDVLRLVSALDNDRAAGAWEAVEDD
jgi:hypothetical protein